jgi:hypothetical protein
MEIQGIHIKITPTMLFITVPGKQKFMTGCVQQKSSHYMSLFETYDNGIAYLILIYTE